MHDFGCILLGFPRLVYGVVQVDHMMAGLISVGVLTDHTGAEYRKFVIRRRVISEHAVQFLRETFFTAGQCHEPVDVLLHGPEILPAVAFTDMRDIFIRMEIFYKVPFVISWLHERSSGIV